MKAKSKPKKKQLAREARDELAREQRERMQVPDPLSRENIKKLGLRLGIPIAVGWVLAIAIGGWIAPTVAGVLTLVIAGIVLWAFRFASKSRAVADIVRAADSAESRKEALEKLDTQFKSGDTAATFAKAQLQMQEDPRAALSTLETINLDKVMAPVADEARSQRAMIHLMLGEVDKARPLADKVDLARHKEPKIRATLAAVVGEAWARSGQAKKAVELLETFDPEDEAYRDLRPQLYRSLAFAYAWGNQTKKMRQVLRKMKGLNVQLLMGFITKKKNPQGVSPRGVHPMLEKEAFDLVMKSGAVPRRMQVKRMM
ncbi:MAG TPA: hypothetical protein VFB62_12030 [Polyangiaceae bacterium]|nr:hypothetical protein [Polyangiaceae bacterium]